NADYLVQHNSGEKLYIKIVSTVTSHIKQMAATIEASQGSLFLEELNKRWMEHEKAFDILRWLFICMDSTCIPSTHEAGVQMLEITLWVDNIINYDKIKMKLKAALAETVQRDREGLSVYQEEFEKPFLDLLTSFYRGKSKQLIRCCDCAEYLKETENCLDGEIMKMITSVVEKEMIESHMLELIQMEKSGLVNMIVDDKYDDLARMYNLFGRVPNGIMTIKDVMTCHIPETCKQLATDPERFKGPVDFVQRLLDEKDKYDKIINLAFKADMEFQNALNSSFEYFINLNPGSPEFISLFVDDKLRKAELVIEEDDWVIVLDKMVTLVCYLQDKGLFKKYFKHQLAERLFLGSPMVSEEIERSFLLKLKNICGNLDISDLENMLKDIMTSRDTVKGFHVDMKRADGPRLGVQVFSTGSWPSQLTRTTTCNLPPEIIRMYEKFRKYYLGIHKGRKLTWQTNVGSAVIKATFGTKRYELSVSTYQMCVLMLFNNAELLSYKEIQQAVEIPTVELKRCLQSLACAAEEEKNVLRKEPISTHINEDDVFTVNEMFSSKCYKLKVGNGTVGVANMESEPGKQEKVQTVEKDRKQQIGTCIHC
ncbi:cullin-3A-like protein isoform X1, partial [Tanacetum coccineum]